MVELTCPQQTDRPLNVVSLKDFFETLKTGTFHQVQSLKFEGVMTVRFFMMQECPTRF